jgi:hypothetical protein
MVGCLAPPNEVILRGVAGPTPANDAVSRGGFRDFARNDVVG